MTGLSESHSQILEEQRGLDPELLARLGLSSSDRGGAWVEIPYFVKDEKVNTKYRTITGDKKFSQDAGAKKCFWNQDVISDPAMAGLPLIICEGEFDAIAAIQAGFPRSISVPDGAPAEEQGAEDHGKKYSYVTDAPAELRDVKEIILCTDSDTPGINLMNDLAVRLGKPRCKFVRYPKDCKDLNDALIKYGARGVVATVTRAQWIRVEGVFKMSELPPLVNPPAYNIGIAGLEKHYKIRLGDFCVITGIPGHGKSSIINEIASRMAIEYGWVTAFASFEQRPQTDHRRALRTFFNRKKVAYQNNAELEKADQWIENQFVFIIPDEEEEATLPWLIERAQAAIVQYGAKIIVVDPWNEMDHIKPPDMSLTEYTGFAIKQFRKLAFRYHVHVIVAAHPTKLSKDKDGKRPIPDLYDISDSAHWANKSDIGIIIHRKTATRTLIRIQKSKYHDEIGVPGDLEALFLDQMGCYEIIHKEKGKPVEDDPEPPLPV